MLKRYLIRNKNNGYVHGEYESIANLNKGIGRIKACYKYSSYNADGFASLQEWLDGHELVTLEEISAQQLLAKN